MMDLTEYRHSNEFPSEVWDKAKCPTQFRPRISRYASVADDACWTVRDDMVAAGGNESITRGVGCVDPVSGNAMAIWFPEALPERLYIGSYMIEFAFMHDDLADSAETSEEFDQSNQALIDSLELKSRDEKKNRKNLIMKSTQARFAVEALDTDEEVGTWLIEQWKNQFSVSSEQRDKEYTAIEDYLKFRIVDAGADIFLVMMRFVSDTTITRAEVESVKYISDLILHAQILWHDYASWQKEIDAFESGQAASLVNAVSILMKKHNVDAEGAKRLLWDETLEYERRYCEERDLFIQKNSPGPEFHRWFRLLELSTGGNAIWSFTSPRYHKDAPRPVRARKANGSTTSGNSTTQATHKTSNGSSKVNGNGVLNKVGTKRKLLTPDTSEPEEESDAPREKRVRIIGPPAEHGSSHSAKTNGDPHREVDEDSVTTEPYKYISSLPAKGARDQLLDALNTWYNVPDGAVTIIRRVVEIMHNVSLMLDDIQDNSPMRRGFPSTHVIFGEAQTINTSTFMYTKGLEAASRLSPKAFLTLIEELKQLHIGQAHDLHETYHCTPPSLPEYFKRIEQKTGGLFRMASKMMQAEASRNTSLNIDALMNILGRYYQIRDDYQDITGTSTGKSAHYGDLDQGTFTLPVMHALEDQEKKGSTELLSIFQARRNTSRMSADMKKLVLLRLEEAGSLKYTKDILTELHDELKQELAAVEEQAGSKNWILRLLLHKLKI